MPRLRRTSPAAHGIMGRGPKITPDAMAKKLIEQDRALREKLEHTRCTAFLKTRPDLVASMKKVFMDGGEIGEDWACGTVRAR